MSIETQGLPSSVDAECMLLGAIFSDPSCFGDVAGLIERDDLTLDIHRTIFDAAAGVWGNGNPPDRLAVYHEAEKRKRGIVTLSALADFAVEGNIESCIRTIKEKSTLRKTAIAAHHLYERCVAAADDPGELVAEGERVLREIGVGSQKPAALKSMFDVFTDMGGMAHYNQPLERGIQTPWPGLNRKITGLRPKQLVTLAGLTGSGKTTAAMQIARHAAGMGEGVAFFSLEMDREEILTRMACLDAGVSTTRVDQQTLNADDRRKFAKSMSEIVKIPLYVDDTTGCSIPAMHQALRKLMASVVIGLVVVDYIQLVEPVGTRRGNQTRQEIVAEISRGLKVTLARALDIPVLALAQFSREAEKLEFEEPKLSHLKESSAIAQDSDKVIFAHRWEKVDTVNWVPTRASMIVKKQRRGPAGQVPMLFMHREGGRFVESEEGRMESEQ